MCGPQPQPCRFGSAIVFGLAVSANAIDTCRGVFGGESRIIFGEESGGEGRVVDLAYGAASAANQMQVRAPGEFVAGLVGGEYMAVEYAGIAEQLKGVVDRSAAHMVAHILQSVIQLIHPEMGREFHRFVEDGESLGSLAHMARAEEIRQLRAQDLYFRGLGIH